MQLQGRGVVAAVLLAGGLIAALPTRVGAQQVQAVGVRAVQDLDQNRFVGTWFEVARYPYKREKACVSNTVLLVALADKANQMQFVNSCMDKKGYEDVRRSTARGPKPKPGKAVSTGEFKVTSLWPFSTKIWVLGLAPDNSWALVGSPDHKHLWVFAKTAVMEPATLSQVKQMAAGEGYDVGKLTMTARDQAGAVAGAMAGAK